MGFADAQPVLQLSTPLRDLSIKGPRVHRFRDNLA